MQLRPPGFERFGVQDFRVERQGLQVQGELGFGLRVNLWHMYYRVKGSTSVGVSDDSVQGSSRMNL